MGVSIAIADPAQHYFVSGASGEIRNSFNIHDVQSDICQ